MKLIEKIEIHRFRSISDSEIIADSLNVFSGSNNSGKSNVLRALNLFFNGQTSFNNDFDFDTDYNKAYTGWYGGKREIIITLHFSPQGNAVLSHPFRIIRTFTNGIVGLYQFESDDADVTAKLLKKDGNVLRQFNTFLGKIQYFYIPAVRDKQFVRNLFLNFEKIIATDQDSDFDGKLKELSSILEKKSNEISRDFEGFIGLKTQATLSSNINDILGAVEIAVASGIEITERVANKGKKREINVNLFSTGDGILMSYLAYFLAHICKKLPNKHFIWGFEEPENSLEYSKSQRLANDFIDKFSNDAQIFITSHSPAFINLKNVGECTFYRVYIEKGDSKRLSQISSIASLKERQEALFNVGDFSEKYLQLSNEIGMVEQASEIEDIITGLVQQQKSSKQVQDLYIEKHASLLNTQPNKIFICEDSSSRTVELWKHWFSLLDLEDIIIWSSGGCTNYIVENSIVHQIQNVNHEYKPKIFRQIDRDGMTQEQINPLVTIYREKYNRKFDYEILPLTVNEIENFAIISNDIFDDAFWADNKEMIKDKFSLTAESLLAVLSKQFYRTEHELLYQNKGKYTAIIQNMWTTAESNWHAYATGKDLVKKATNFDPIDYLARKEYSELPNDLKSYLTTIKTFLT